MALQSQISLLCVTIALHLAAPCAVTTAAAEPGLQTYKLEALVDLALSRNPVVASAEGHIEQQRGQQTAAGAYPNPTVLGSAGYGEIRDTGRAQYPGFARSRIAGRV